MVWVGEGVLVVVLPRAVAMPSDVAGSERAKFSSAMDSPTMGTSFQGPQGRAYGTSGNHELALLAHLIDYGSAQ